MTDPADVRFFTAIKAVCRESGEAGDGLLRAVDRALETGDPQDMMEARKAFEAADESILRRVHLRMVTDISAIWDEMPCAPGRQRPN